jgi:hypothetical protein
MYRFGVVLGSVGHRVKIQKITPTTDKERGVLEIKDYVILQKTQELADRLPPPRTLILDFSLPPPRTLILDLGRSHVWKITLLYINQNLINRDLLSTRLIVGKVGSGMWCCKFNSTSNVLVCETQRKVNMYGCVSE